MPLVVYNTPQIIFVFDFIPWCLYFNSTTGGLPLFHVLLHNRMTKLRGRSEKEVNTKRNTVLLNDASQALYTYVFHFRNVLCVCVCVTLNSDYEQI
jgi:hypothetical protein